MSVIMETMSQPAVLKETVTEYRFLSKEEWEKLGTLGLPGPYPSPEVSAAVVAERDGDIVAVLFLQLAAHMEPLYIAPNHTGLVNFKTMVEQLESLLPQGQSFYVFSPDSKIGGMAKAVGMSQLPYRVWFKEV